MRRIKRKRSPRGRLFLGLAYLLVISIALLVLGAIADSVNENENRITDDEAMDRQPREIKVVTDVMHVDEDISKSISDKEKDYKYEDELISKLLSLVLAVPYEENGKSYIDESGMIVTEGLDNFGLVDYTYLCATGRHLNEDGIASIKDLSLISENDLKIGDVGVGYIGQAICYGVYVGKYGSYPLFVYVSDLSNGLFNSGSVYLSYNKTECNDLFAGMFPIEYSSFYRLPNMDYGNAGSKDILTYLDERIIPSESYLNCAEATYRIGEWFKNNDSNKLIERMNVEALESSGYVLDEEAFKKYVEDYQYSINHSNYLFRILSYVELDGYSIVHAEVVTLGDKEQTFKNSGKYFDCTIYDNGTFLAGTISNISMYSLTYGYKLKDSVSNGSVVENNPNITPYITENINEDIENMIVREEKPTVLKGRGFTIDIPSLTQD